jgi:branched-chain amino acid transport system ATP-binding protein
MSKVLELRGVSAHYGASQILHGIDLRLARGEVVCLLGLNGMGKTTTLRAIMGLVEMVTGTISVDGAALPASTWRRARAGITLVPEDRRVFPTLSVRENLAAATKAARNGKSFRLDDVLALFPRLKERLAQLAGTMSGGEQQMLSVARALVLNPEFLLLDEPTEGLAPSYVETIRDAILAAKDRGIGVLLVEQSIALAMSVGNRFVVIENGRVVLTESSGSSGFSAEVLQSRLSISRGS